MCMAMPGQPAESGETNNVPSGSRPEGVFQNSNPNARPPSPATSTRINSLLNLGSGASGALFCDSSICGLSNQGYTTKHVFKMGNKHGDLSPIVEAERAPFQEMAVSLLQPSCKKSTGSWPTCCVFLAGFRVFGFKGSSTRQPTMGVLTATNPCVGRY